MATASGFATAQEVVIPETQRATGSHSAWVETKAQIASVRSCGASGMTLAWLQAPAPASGPWRLPGGPDLSAGPGSCLQRFRAAQDQLSGLLELVKCLPSVCFVPAQSRWLGVRRWAKSNPTPRLLALWGVRNTPPSPQQKCLGP